MTGKDLGDGVAWLGALGAINQALPTVVAVLSIIWFLIRIGEWAWSKFRKNGAGAGTGSVL